MSLLEKLGITPGPWYWKPDHFSIVNCAGGDVLTSFVNGSVDRNNLQEDINTARFVAQAPRMLESLIGYCINFESNEGMNTALPRAWYNLYRDIIEEATGENWEKVKELIQ